MLTPMKFLFQRGWIAGLLLATFSLSAADTLIWRTKEDRVTADIQSAGLIPVLEGVAKLTGWHVFLESNITQNVSVKFKDLPSGDALRFMLGDLNYAFVPQTNGSPRLFVFRTTRANATQAIQPGDLASGKKLEAKTIPNELIVRLKPGASIDELAKKLGAKVIGKIDGLNAYRLQFADEAAADAARALLANNSEVTGVESNYVVDAPPNPVKLDTVTSAAPINLKLSPPNGSSDRATVVLVDTAVQKLNSELDGFLTKTFSVAGTANLDPNTPSHGTSMFESILRGAANASGGSSSLQVIGVDVYGPNATTSSFDVAMGITVGVNNGGNIINLSLGSNSDSPVLRDVIQQALQNGIVIYASAGNNASAEWFYPGAYSGVTSVTASYQGKLAPYANYGAYVKLIAPGTLPVNFGGNTWIVSGTSGATALISGITAGTATSKNVSVGAAANAVNNSSPLQFKP